MKTQRLEEMKDRAELQSEHTANYIAMLERAFTANHWAIAFGG